ncbi:YwqJ-related putative deaminase [Streptomyces erythrochromogenes]|uniref:YwqJ-related putative deaminase n=1 Tax=Streptomyces erythrochromogenes TaxID=285574 RepID=UPI0038153A78
MLAGAAPVLVHNCEVTDAARNSAAEYSALPGRQRQGGAAEALQVKGYKPIVRTSDGGAGDRAVHPAVQNVLDSIPAARQGDNHGGCGLVACLTDALNSGLDPTGASAAAFMIRSPNHKYYLKEMDPCPSCAVLGAHFKIDFKTKW